jgi:hypothetical protein
MSSVFDPVSSFPPPEGAGHDPGYAIDPSGQDAGSAAFSPPGQGCPTATREPSRQIPIEVVGWAASAAVQGSVGSQRRPLGHTPLFGKDNSLAASARALEASISAWVGATSFAPSTQNSSPGKHRFVVVFERNDEAVIGVKLEEVEVIGAICDEAAAS